jgi:phage repressor protein C with HTH and peptisase S24 domain
MVSNPQADNTKSVLDRRQLFGYQIGMKKDAPETGKFPNHLKAYRKRAGLAQHELATASDTKQPTIVKLEKGQRKFTLEWAKRFAPFLHVSAIEMLAGPPTDDSETLDPQPVVQEVLGQGPDVEHNLLANDIPVLGITVGGGDDERHADFWMNGEVINHISRPKSLANAKNVFSLYIDGTSMYPRFRERDLVIVQKAAPSAGDDVVIELKPKTDGGDHPSYIKEFISMRGNTITVRQFNPPKELTFAVSEIENLFRVIPFKEWVG